ncbi:MAG TPA: alcohol dehydrogenase-like regulatory protein ErcA [Dissulfurispiraceae bacterium]|nr:alcohol dehydrogenase-like regulatory protein ErcA [Dissulfurispiraceae bacterium]
MEKDASLQIRKFVAPEFLFGWGSIELAGQYAANFRARKVLLVTDKGVRAAGWTEKVENSLSGAGISYAVFDSVTSDPKDVESSAGAACYHREKCDVIVAVGGGSPMDCAKGIAIIVANGGSVLDYEGVDMVSVPPPPMIFIPTTAGTSADISQFAIITDTVRKVKIAIVSKAIIPDISLIDPQTTLTKSDSLTAATGMDVLTHAVEAYVSNASSPITDLHALESIRIVASDLPKIIDDPKNVQSRTRMMLASLLAGLAFSNASLGMVHAMAHALGGRFGLPHGDCNAILLEHIASFNYDAASDKFQKVLGALGGDESLAGKEGKLALANAISALRKKVGLHGRLHDMGLKKDDFPRLAEFAFNDPCLVTNPKMPQINDIIECYEQAF